MFLLLVVMLDTPCSEVVWRVLASDSIRQFPLHFPSLRHRVPSHFNWTSTSIWLCLRSLRNLLLILMGEQQLRLFGNTGWPQISHHRSKTGFMLQRMNFDAVWCASVLGWGLFNLGKVNHCFHYHDLKVCLGFFMWIIILMNVLIYYLPGCW
jgi:hypothetical protein